ncbi:MAG: carboxypeptidase-like regulatory domain-containing protein [Pedobacter sp.]|nr:MAG: carboxypeptidase-like regulatory domain-containing protein [Pedobacter sp.]
MSGVVRDGRLREPLPYVTVTFKGTTLTTKTDASGRYSINSDKPQTALTFKYVGFRTHTSIIQSGQSQTMNVILDEISEKLTEVKIVATKAGPYRNKENPAVELIRNVITHRPENRMENFNQVAFKQYERLQLSYSNLSEKFKQKKLFKNYQFLFSEQDSDKIGGKNQLPIYLQEKLSDNYFRKNPEKNKKIIYADKHVTYDPNVIDNEGISVYLERMYADINVYDNNILIATTQFLSPIANSAPTFYKYFITDTIKTQSPELIELSFIPRNPQDLIFEGRMYVTNDKQYAVQSIFLKTSRSANLNFVREAELKQSFTQDSTKKYHLSKSNLVVDFGLTKNSGRGFTGERTLVISDYKINKPEPDSIYKGETQVTQLQPASSSDQYWASNRPDTVPAATLAIYKNIDSLGKSKSFKTAMTVAGVVFAGYINFGKFEVGPTYTFYSFDPIQGLKLRLGGRTTTEFSTRYYFDGYASYGFKDEKWKGYLSGAYAFNNKSIYTFPQSFIRASFQRDLYIPGQELRSNSEDDFISSFKRGENNRYLYNDFYRIQYVQEFANHFGFDLGFRKWTQTPAGSLTYNNLVNQLPHTVDQITSSEINLSLRYAPNEKFYQGKRSRVTVNNKYPIYNLRYAVGIKGLVGGEYNYQNLTVSVDKRFYLSQLGISDVKIEGGYIGGKVPYPLLAIHKANQTYAYQIYAFNMMNFLEFVSDQYASIYVDHTFSGFFLNKVPLLKSLKLREYVGFKAIYGGVRSENNPANDPQLLQFPKNADGVPTTYTFDRLPYMEGSVGIGNIFKILRVDGVRRFNYLDHPNAPKYGIRIKLKIEL